jgi:hypothetical protein
MMSGASRPSTITGDDHIRVISAVWVISEVGGGVSLFLLTASSEEPIQEGRSQPEVTETNNHEE